MRTNKIIKGVIIVFLAVTGMSSCREEFEFPEHVTMNDLFDFKTTEGVQFSVNYGDQAAQSLLNVFASNPIELQEDGVSIKIVGEPIYQIFMDNDGKFIGNVDMPSYLKTVYLLDESYCCPFLVEAEVKNGSVVVDTTIGTETRGVVATRAIANPRAITINSNKKLYAIVDTSNKYGAIEDINGIKSIINSNAVDYVTADELNAIRQTLWHGETSKYDAWNKGKLENADLVLDTEHINTTIASTYRDATGLHTIETAQLWFTFLTERAGYQSTVGYYYYPSGQVPTSGNNVEKFIIVPNASIANDGPFDQSNDNNNGYKTTNAPISSNTRIQLLYKKEDGTFTVNFPAGTTIGFFAISDSWTPNNWNINNKAKGYNLNKDFLYSNYEWNNARSGFTGTDLHKKSRFLTAQTASGIVIYGFEDGGDNSYEDILFTVTADPKEAIQDPERPVIDPVTQERITNQALRYTYAYEDIWPRGGDYDMNDVIIEHTRTISFNQYNYVTKVEDEYIPVQPAGSATYSDAFAVEVNNEYSNSQTKSVTSVWTKTGTSYTCPDYYDSKSGFTTFIVIADTKESDAYQKSFKLTRTFAKTGSPTADRAEDRVKTAVLKAEFENAEHIVADTNPFIISQYVSGQQDGYIEVHQVGGARTSRADGRDITENQRQYYGVDKLNGQSYPFAVYLPIHNWKPSPEKVVISDSYREFTSWASSTSTNTDWYLHPSE